MKTKKKAGIANEAPEPKPEVLRDEPRTDAPAGEGEFERKSFAFYVDKKGEIAWDKMREKTKGELREFLKRPDVGKALQIEPPKEVVEVMSVEWCASLYDGVGKIEAALASKWKGIPKEIAEQAFAYSEFEKSQLGPPTARVINKYATDWMVKFKDEISLAFLLTTITLAKIQMCNALLAAHNPSAAPAPVTSIDTKKESVVQ